MKKNIVHIIQFTNAIMIGICVILQLFSLGAYELDSYALGDSDVGIHFESDKSICVAIVGVVLIISLLVQLLYRNKLYFIGSIFVLISSKIQLLFIGTAFSKGAYIIELDIYKRFFLTGGMERMKKMLKAAERFPLNKTPIHRAKMGLFLFEILSKLINILTIVSICYIVIWIVGFTKKAYIEKNIKFLFCKEKKKTKFEVTKLICRVINAAVGIIIFVCIYRYSYATHDMTFLEMLSKKQEVLLGYAIPILLFCVVVIDKWICEEKLVYVCLAYMTIAHYMYIVYFYTEMMFWGEQTVEGYVGYEQGVRGKALVDVWEMLIVAIFVMVVCMVWRKYKHETSKD